MVLQRIIAHGAIAWTALSNLGRPTSETAFLRPEDAIQSDAYFYGASPPVYPSPLGNGTGDWGDAYAKAEQMVAQLTMDEKIALTSGSSEWTGCDGSIAPIPRVGFPGLCLKDASNGLRGIDFVNGYPSGIHVGASWNKDLTYRRANHMAREFRAKGVNLLLGPTIGPMGRVIRGGRNWESFSIDPYLSGQLVQETVTGIQNTGVMASTKHFLGNEQETNRQDSATASRGANPGIEGVSVNMDDKTMHELYLWPFQDAVKAGSGSIMCSYNRLNNSYACQNSKLLNGLLKSELGFQGYVLTDWEGQHSGVASALAGLDMTMPSPKDFWGQSLGISVKNGSVPEERLDDMAKRVLAPWYKMGQNEGYPSRGMHFEVDAKDTASKQVLFDGAVEGHVLVKNEGNILPLKSPKMLSIYGYDAKTPDAMNGDLPNRGIKVQAAMSGTLLSGGGSAAITPARVSSPYAAIEQRSYEDNTSLYSDFVNENPRVHGNSDACLVFINAWAEEDWDRPGIQDDYSDNLVNNVANGCANTIVVIHNAGIRLVDRFQSHPNVKAIIFGHLPGQDSGRALVSLLYGDENFSGKLPYTVAQTEADYGHLLNPDQPEGIYAKFPQSNFSEGVFVDYRAFDKFGITPSYEFGFGLSYTTFQYSNLETHLTSSALPSSGSRLPAFPTGKIQQGGQVDLWETIARVSAKIQNVGERDGKEVVQLYVGIPGDAAAAPVRQLRGFVKRHLAVGETATVDFALTRRDLSFWDTKAQKWNLQRGEYRIWVGSSSRILPLAGILRI